MRNSLYLLAVSVLFVASIIGCVGCAVESAPTTQPARPDTKPAPAPAPHVKVKVLLFTMQGCGPCVQLKTMLHDPALKDVLVNVEVEEVKKGDPRCREYNVTSYPTLIALTSAGPKRYPQGGTLGQLAKWLGDVAENPQALPETAGEALRRIGKFVAGGEVGPEGQEIATDLPHELRMKNVGGRDGAGLCVFSSLGHAARFQNERKLWDIQKDMRKEPGGGYPEKVDRMIEKYGKGTSYLQYEGKDPTILELALRTGRMPCVTYCGRDGTFYHGNISHMINLVYLDKSSAGLLDNNYPDKILWCSRQEFLDRWTGGRSGWAVVLLSPRPPAPPRPAK